MNRYDEQEGAKKGYNSNIKGRASHHPLIAFITDVKIVNQHVDAKFTHPIQRVIQQSNCYSAYVANLKLPAA